MTDMYELKGKKVYIAMSGGVDSSVAAYLLQQQGCECIGVTMTLQGFGTDCDRAYLQCAADAAELCRGLHMRHITVDMTADFKEHVVDAFIAAYEQGLTPNPCIECNRFIKFTGIRRAVESTGEDTAGAFLATGHYARIGYHEGRNRYCVMKAADKSKDQSYVLFGLSQDLLKQTLFPLGDYTKEEIRRIAAEQGFVTAHKKDSQDICFIPDGDYVGFIKRTTGKDYPPGKFVLRDGTVMGEHKGLIGYTIGQRKGLGLALPAPLYVSEKNPENNTVVLSDNESLFTHELRACPCLPGDLAIEDDTPLQVKIRYAHKPQNARVSLKDGILKVCFDEAVRAVTAGQYAVLYEGDYCLGGGRITAGC